MVDRTPRPLRGTEHTRRTTQSVPWLLTLILAWPAVSRLQAQQPAPAPNEAPRPVPRAPETPPPALGQVGQPLPLAPQQALPPPSTASGASATVTLAVSSAQRFQFKVDPKTPLKDLLPTPPKTKKIPGPLLGNDLTRVPEVRFQEHPAKGVPGNEAMKQIAFQIAKINHLNDKKTDGFVEALRGERLDLNGLPFAMGDACRTNGERTKQFARAVATVRRALQRSATPAAPSPLPAADSSLAVPPPVVGSSVKPTSASTPQPAPPVLAAEPSVVDHPSAENFWEQYQTLCAQEDRVSFRLERSQRETIAVARIAALMQVLAPMKPAMHLGLVKYLSTVSHIEATRALGRLAIFSTEEEVRRAALDALKVRRERDYTAVLLRGLHYPWPVVARRAAEAITKLERTDMVPQLIALLEEPDPRAPVMKEIRNKRVPVVRELVRVNHHRNCLLCHAPGNTGQVSPEAVTAAVPVPGEPLPSQSDGYRISSPDIIVRVDVTYLRQDFSALQPVADAHPWPEMQRFDFLVRTRVLSEAEAKEYRDKLMPREPGEFTPYQRAALAALRELTGRDTEPTPEAWRRLLKLPAEQSQPSKTP